MCSCKHFTKMDTNFSVYSILSMIRIMLWMSHKTTIVYLYTCMIRLKPLKQQWSLWVHLYHNQYYNINHFNIVVHVTLKVQALIGKSCVILMLHVLQDVNDYYSMRYPKLYTPGHLNLLFNKKVCTVESEKFCHCIPATTRMVTSTACR